MAQIFDDNIFDIRSAVMGSGVFGGGKVAWGQFVYTFTDAVQTEVSTSSIPAYAIDPPVPPVWPILGAGRFASDTIYGKERMNTNLRMIMGDKYQFDVVTVVDGELFDLTGYNITMTCRKNRNDVSQFFQLTSNPANGIVITNAANGEFTVTIAASLTSSLPKYIMRFPYDIQISSGSNIYTISTGTLIISPDVT